MILGVAPGTLVIRPRITVDFELLMQHLLTYSGLAVKSAIDVDSFDVLPLLTHAHANGHMISNGYPSAGWEHTLFLSLYVVGLEQGADLADTVYQNVHGMEERVVAGLGAVNTVEDESMFDRIGGGTLADKQIVQYNATFTVRVTPA